MKSTRRCREREMTGKRWQRVTSSQDLALPAEFNVCFVSTVALQKPYAVLWNAMVTPVINQCHKMIRRKLKGNFKQSNPKHKHLNHKK